jgi:hypothetical protein
MGLENGAARGGLPEAPVAGIVLKNMKISAHKQPPSDMPK